jgi:glycosyltransferase involved in cell wall biosynthesis
VFLTGLSTQELAAFYRMAALAVNPSLFEGGLPFTFSESLSVGTPIVMARIPVTVDAIHDSELRERMLFDPYDWKDIAARIEWALGNRDELARRQSAYFESEIATRSWDDVLGDYVEILRRIGANATETRPCSGRH